jgi:putative phosphoesterase
MRALVISDTHLGPEALERMPAEVWTMADAADVVLHAGDVVHAAALAALGERALVHAVLGNNDHALVGQLPEVLEVELGGVRVAMVHDSGASAGRGARMTRRFPEAGVVVFGHSHDPLVEQVPDGPLLVNPGSPTQRRRQPVHTVAWLELAHGRVERAELVPVGPLAARGFAIPPAG